MKKVTINLSDNREGTNAPFWVIIDPHQMMRANAQEVALNMIRGVWFSRESAEEHFRECRYRYGERAQVWCLSGHSSEEWCQAIKEAEGRRDLISKMCSLFRLIGDELERSEEWNTFFSSGKYSDLVGQIDQVLKEANCERIKMSELSDYALDVEPIPIPDVKFPFYACYDKGTLDGDVILEIGKDSKLFTPSEKEGLIGGWITLKVEELPVIALRMAERLCRSYISEGTVHKVEKFKERGWVIRVNFYQDDLLKVFLGSFIAKIDPDSSLTDLSITVLNE